MQKPRHEGNGRGHSSSPVVGQWHRKHAIYLCGTWTSLKGEEVERRSENGSWNRVPTSYCPIQLLHGGCWLLGFLLCPRILLKARTRKWTVKVTSHFITFATCNEWIEYIRNGNKEGHPKKDVKRYYEIPVGHSTKAHCQRQEWKAQEEKAERLRIEHFYEGPERWAKAHKLYKIWWHQAVAKAHQLQLRSTMQERWMHI